MCRFFLVKVVDCLENLIGKVGIVCRDKCCYSYKLKNSLYLSVYLGKFSLFFILIIDRIICKKDVNG